MISLHVLEHGLTIEVLTKLQKKSVLKELIISDLDLFIGATAIINDMILVTRNVKEFERMENLKIENWIDNQ